MRIRVHGRSMLPALVEGAEVEIAVFARRPRIGDVVLFLDETGATILHRVIDVDSRSLQTLGDSAAAPDPRVPLDRVLGIARLPRRAGYSRARRFRFRAGAALRRLVTRLDA